MRVPKVKKRRHLDPPGDRRRMAGLNFYYESDHTFMDNNRRACIWFLENRDLINKLLKDR